MADEKLAHEYEPNVPRFREVVDWAKPPKYAYWHNAALTAADRLTDRTERQAFWDHVKPYEARAVALYDEMHAGTATPDQVRGAVDAVVAVYERVWREAGRP